jgi:hypothetical protein
MNSVTDKRKNHHDFLVIVTESLNTDPHTPRNTINHSEWTPRAELRAWISRKIRRWPSELFLLLRAGAAVRWGSNTECNLAVDAVLLHEEAGTQ